jgi:hypothetical protein
MYIVTCIFYFFICQYGCRKTGGVAHVPPGWDWWIGLVGNSRYYNYTLSVNGTAVFHSDDYLTNVIVKYQYLLCNKNHGQAFTVCIYAMSYLFNTMGVVN